MVNKLILFICLLGLMNACTYRKQEMELVETKCKNFKVETPLYEWIEDPTCDGDPKTGQLKIVINYSGEADCINKVLIEPEFYKVDNTKLTAQSYTSSVTVGEPTIEITGTEIILIFDFEMLTIADANDLNHILFEFYTTNEIGNKSKPISLRVNGTCSTVASNTYTVQQTVDVPSKNVVVTFFDDAAEDQDVISVNLNGVWVIENLTLTNAEQNFSFVVNNGNNNLVVFAVNEGTTGPNTVAIKVNGGTSINLSPDLETGKAINIRF
jgi:hypothetical protein